MRSSVRPQIVGNIQPLLLDYLEKYENKLQIPEKQTAAYEAAHNVVGRSEEKIKDRLGELLPSHRFPLMTPIWMAAGKDPTFPTWHVDDSGLALMSSHLVTEFLEGEYEPIRPRESYEDFDVRIDRSVNMGELAPVPGIEPGDIVLSINDGVYSALHRAAPNKTAHNIRRLLIVGSLIKRSAEP